MNEVRHIFLTGRKQVGKSTLLRRLIRENALDCSGFETRPFLIDGERKGFSLHGHVELPSFEQDVIISVRIAQRWSVPVLPAFEENGVRILRLSMEDRRPCVLMDELGRMEAEAPEFRKCVLETLDSGKSVIGILQQCDSPLVKEISARPDVYVFDITEENRDTIYPQINDLLAQIRQTWGND